MSTGTSIEWTDASWNALRAKRIDTGKTGWHCEKVSDGCKHCYSETFNGRMLPNGGTGLPYSKASRAKVETYIDEKALMQPLHWKKPRKVFVCSMTDLFGEWVSYEQIDRVMAVMALCPQHTFQILTKRPERMAEYFSANRGPYKFEPGNTTSLDLIDLQREEFSFDGNNPVNAVRLSAMPWPLPNVWLGTSTENQVTADERIPHLLLCPAAVHFVSAEPLLGPIDFSSAVIKRRIGDTQPKWIICGGESGPGARPCNIEWIRSIVGQCKAAGVACFVKQVGAHTIGPDPDSIIDIKDSKGGDPAEWPDDLRVREMPEVGR